MAFTYNTVNYLGGIPSYPSPAPCRLIIDEYGITLMRWWSKVAMISIDNVHSMRVVPYTVYSPSQTVNKSVVKRAILGGVLLGPLGAVVGGMSGIGQKSVLTDEQKRHANDSVLLVDGTDSGLMFRCGFIFPAFFLKESAATKPMKQITKMRALFLKNSVKNSLPSPPKSLT